MLKGYVVTQSVLCSVPRKIAAEAANEQKAPILTVAPSFESTIFNLP
jgi:hypothetical protein